MRSPIRTFSMVMGIIFLVVGGMGFIPGLLTQPEHAVDHPMAVHAFDGYLLGLFHVNFWHSLAHLLFGILGVFCANSVGHARGYARFVAIAYALLAIMGLIPGLSTLWGVMPLHGNDVWLHVAIAAVAAYFGFARVPVAGDGRGGVTEARA
jgi:hypothetical protein